MKIAKAVAGAFVVGGAFALIGELLNLMYTALLGIGSPYVMFAVLVTLGVLAFVLYSTGVQKKISKAGGFGAILPFNGFACGIADSFGAGQGTGQRWAGALKTVLFGLGIGSFVSVAIAAAMVLA